MTLLFWVSIFFAAALADTLLCHGEVDYLMQWLVLGWRREAKIEQPRIKELLKQLKALAVRRSG